MPSQSARLSRKWPSEASVASNSPETPRNSTGSPRAITTAPNISGAFIRWIPRRLPRRATASSSHAVRFHLPETDNQAAGKLRPGFHPFAAALTSAPILDNRTDRQASPGLFPREPRPAWGSHRNGHFRLPGRSSHNRTKPDKTLHPKGHLPPAISHAINTLAPTRRLRSRTKIFASTRTSAPKPLSLCAARCTESRGQTGHCSTVSLREADTPNAPPWASQKVPCRQHEPDGCAAPTSSPPRGKRSSTESRPEKARSPAGRDVATSMLRR